MKQNRVAFLAIARRATTMSQAAYIKHLRKLHYTRIGSGAYAEVYRSPDKRHVIKVGCVSGNRSYLRFAAYAQAHPCCKWLPGIIDAGIYSHRGTAKYFAIAMETLQKIATKKYDHISPCIEDPDSSIDLHESGLLKFEDKEFIPVLKFLKLLRKSGASFDLHENNVMLRGQHPVITDPVTD